MALNIHTKNVKNGTELWVDAEDGGKHLNGTTHTLGLLSINGGYRKITKENVFEVFRRVALMEHHYGPMRANDKGPILFTFEEVARHIGLETNAIEMTAIQFDKKLRELTVRDLREQHGRRVADDDTDWLAE